jgi:hypothetical protein
MWPVRAPVGSAPRRAAACATDVVQVEEAAAAEEEDWGGTLDCAGDSGAERSLPDRCEAEAEDWL